MAPAIPLIAAGLTAVGGIAAAKISSNGQAKAAALSRPSTSATSYLTDPAKMSSGTGVQNNFTSPLGDTSSASLSRKKLLGN